MDELVLHEYSRSKGAIGAAFIVAVGLLLVFAGALKALDGGVQALLSLIPIVAGVLLLWFAAYMIKNGRGTPDRMALTSKGVLVARGSESYLLPSDAIVSFGLEPVKTFHSINVRYDPARAPALPGYIARLGKETPPGVLRLLFVSEKKPLAPPERVDEAREFIRRHDLGAWP
ncbi:hypothetical protein [Spirillospora sp. CA-294931]|uniref:hypothetical protein n=1 Tax=Spirillospora sp. CA-294931 TaxID=3240042 RepID=UPI003D94624B